MNAICRLLPLLLVSVLLSGCGGNFLVGKWTLDRETTVAALTPAAPEPTTPEKGFLKEVVSGLQKGLSRLLLTQFEGVEIEFTTSEMRRVRNGVGEAMAYKIIEKPGGGRLVLQYADGEIATWAKAETGVKMRLPGEEESWVYFKPVP